VTVVGGGRAALDKIGAGEHFDAIVCDLMMPEMTGASSTRSSSDVPHQVRQVISHWGALPRPPSGSRPIDNARFEKP
jgi:CheY-like chemotaxis protein